MRFFRSAIATLFIMIISSISLASSWPGDMPPSTSWQKVASGKQECEFMSFYVLKGFPFGALSIVENLQRDQPTVRYIPMVEQPTSDCRAARYLSHRPDARLGEPSYELVFRTPCQGDPKPVLIISLSGRQRECGMTFGEQP